MFFLEGNWLAEVLVLVNGRGREAVYAGHAALFLETFTCSCSSRACLWICNNDNKNSAFLLRCLRLWLLMVIFPLNVPFALSCQSNVENVFLSGL